MTLEPSSWSRGELSAVDVVFMLAVGTIFVMKQTILAYIHTENLTFCTAFVGVLSIFSSPLLCERSKTRLLP